MNYPPGATVTFADQPHNVVWNTDQPTVCTGTVNGEPMEEGGEVWVPVWCERDNGREPTTIFVREENILQVK